MSDKYLASAVGNTPLIKIKSLSDLTGCEIFGKAEFMNPGGSVKDRTALGIIKSAELANELRPGMTIVEGSAGNTGIGLATLAPSLGYKVLIVLPNNQAEEKYQTLEALGAKIVKVAPCPFADQNHFYHTAKRMAESDPNSYWADQFENTANYEIHKSTTGPEIWDQTNGQVSAFVSAVGTGGTLAGVSAFLKSKSANVHIRLVDPFGSGLFEHFRSGKLLSSGNSITEGIGIMRLTANYKKASVDSAVQISDQEMISMLYYLSNHEGLLVGTSAALNVAAAYKYALENKHSKKTIVTMLCDSALRYQSKLFNPAYLSEKKLQPNANEILSWK